MSAILYFILVGVVNFTFWSWGNYPWYAFDKTLVEHQAVYIGSCWEKSLNLLPETKHPILLSSSRVSRHSTNYCAMPLFLYLYKGMNCWCSLNASERARLFAGPCLLICTARLLYPAPQRSERKGHVRSENSGHQGVQCKEGRGLVVVLVSQPLYSAPTRAQRFIGGPSLNPEQFVWDLWWIKWRRDKFLQVLRDIPTNSYAPSSF